MTSIQDWSQRGQLLRAAARLMTKMADDLNMEAEDMRRRAIDCDNEAARLLHERDAVEALAR